MFHKLKISLLFIFLAVALYGSGYPKTFASLGTPLYKASSQLTHFSKMSFMAKELPAFEEKSRRLKKEGFVVDKSQDKIKKFAYLKALRELQKEYNYVIYLTHKKIMQSIEKDDYDTFIQLTSYSLEGLLEPKSLRKRAIHYYKQKHNQKKSKLLEHYIHEEELLNVAFQESFNQKKVSQYSSQKENVAKHKDVYITTKKYKKFVDIYFTNTNFYDVTIKVTSQNENIKVFRYVEPIFVIKAKSKIHYARFYFNAPHAHYSLHYSWIFGSKDAHADKDYLYRLPFRIGESHMVSQGFHGKTTHKGHSEYAIDFKMDVGTKIYAARDGIVVRIKEDSNKRGFSKAFAKYGNFVLILHSDGTFGTYYHLRKNGVLVNVGQRVSRGTLLGYSGNTGYTSGPHLHFAVLKVLRTLKTQSLPIRFISAQGIIDNPIVGRYYKAK